MKTRAYEKQAEDAPEIEIESALKPIHFESVDQILDMLHYLQQIGEVRVRAVSAQNYEFECIGDKHLKHANNFKWRLPKWV